MDTGGGREGARSGLEYILGILAFIFLRFYLFLDREERRKRERNSKVWLPLAHPHLGTWPANRACALTGNQTSDPVVHGPAFNPLSHTSQSHFGFFTKKPETPGLDVLPHRPRSDRWLLRKLRGESSSLVGWEANLRPQGIVPTPIHQGSSIVLPLCPGTCLGPLEQV